MPARYTQQIVSFRDADANFQKYLASERFDARIVSIHVYALEVVYALKDGDAVLVSSNAVAYHDGHELHLIARF